MLLFQSWIAVGALLSVRLLHRPRAGGWHVGGFDCRPHGSLTLAGSVLVWLRGDLDAAVQTWLAGFRPRGDHC